MPKHYETHAYGYATALLVGWNSDNLTKYREKVLNLECTEGQLLLLEKYPETFIKGGWPAITQRINRES